jgi:hypothetical protein
MPKLHSEAARRTDYSFLGLHLMSASETKHKHLSIDSIPKNNRNILGGLGIHFPTSLLLKGNHVKETELTCCLLGTMITYILRTSYICKPNN